MILIATGGPAFTVSAEDLFLGRVHSVDRDAGKLSVELMDDGNSPDGKDRVLHVNIPVDRYPASLLPGSVVRIWGGVNPETGMLDATQMQVPGKTGYGQDQTGVRRRLGKSHGQYGGRGGSKGRGR